jgi:hypothetical protein
MTMHHIFFLLGELFYQLDKLIKQEKCYCGNTYSRLSLVIKAFSSYTDGLKKVNKMDDKTTPEHYNLLREVYGNLCFLRYQLSEGSSSEKTFYDVFHFLIENHLTKEDEEILRDLRNGRTEVNPFTRDTCKEVLDYVNSIHGDLYLQMLNHPSAPHKC